MRSIVRETLPQWLWSKGVCVPKSSSVLIARPNRLNVSGDDRALLALPGPHRLAVQVKEPTCGRERGAPSSTDCAAAEGERSRPAHEWGSLVLGHAVSMVSIDPQGHHDHPARDPCALAPGRLPAILAAEIPLVCTENSDSNVLVMHAADEGMRYDASGALNRARDRRILV